MKHDLNQDQFILLFTCVEWLQIKVGIKYPFAQYNKVFIQNHANKLSVDSKLDLAMIDCPRMDCKRGGIAFQNKFSDAKNPLFMLENIVSARKPVWNNCKTVHENGEPKAQSLNSCVKVDIFCPNPKVSAASVLSNVRPAGRRSYTLWSGFAGVFNANKVEPMERYCWQDLKLEWGVDHGQFKAYGCRGCKLAGHLDWWQR